MGSKVYYCYVNQKRTKTKDEAVKLRYDPNWNFNFIEGVDSLSQLKKDDLVFFNDIFDLSDGFLDAQKAQERFMELKNKEVDVRFEKSPIFDSGYVEYVIEKLCDALEISEPNEKVYNCFFEFMFYAHQQQMLQTAMINSSLARAASKVEGKQLGRKAGTRIETKKGKKAKEVILTMSKAFGGTLSDKECIPLSGVSKNQYYIYKKRLLQERDNKDDSIKK